MKETEQSLFDVKTYETDPRIRIPELLGKQPGEYFGVSRFISLYVSNAPDNEVPLVVFAPTDQPTNYDAMAYAADDSNFGNDFRYWEQVVLQNDTVFSGYLVGFPVLHDAERRSPLRMLHFWENNASVFDGTYAVPLTSLGELAIHSKLETDIRVDRDELCMGDVASRFEVPLLRDTDTGETHYRTATIEDLEEILKNIDQLPTVIYGHVNGLGAHKWADTGLEQLLR